jgi:hypothetical protein
MAAETNASGIVRLLYLAAGAAVASWALWGADQGWTQWTWLTLGGLLLICGAIGYSPLHAMLSQKQQKAA